MPLASAIAQNLPWLSAACVLKVKGGDFVFRWRSEKEITLPVEGAVPAGVAPIDFCADGILGDWAVPGLDLEKTGIIAPRHETRFSFCKIYLARANQNPPQGADLPFFTGSHDDLLALQRLGCSLSPLLEYLFLASKSADIYEFKDA